MTCEPTCAVSACGQTGPDDIDEFICSTHWDAIPLAVRRAFTHFRQRSKAHPQDENLRQKYDEAWERCVEIAIELDQWEQAP